MNSFWRKFTKRFHPEGIPWPGSVLYRAISGTAIFLGHYRLVAQDVAHCRTSASILDIGTGPGQLLLAIRKLLPDATLIGVDISSAMVKQARRTIGECNQNSRIHVQVADAIALPFADGTFDCVVSTGSLHHWKDPIHALSETYRVLKPDGTALIYDLVRDMPKTVRNDIRTRFGGFRFALLWLHSFEEPFLNAEEMEYLGKGTDFVVEGTKFTGALCCLVLKKAAFPAKDQEMKRIDE